MFATSSRGPNGAGGNLPYGLDEHSPTAGWAGKAGPTERVRLGTLKPAMEYAMLHASPQKLQVIDCHKTVKNLSRFCKAASVDLKI